MAIYWIPDGHSINTHLKNANLTNVKLDSLKGDKPDWLLYIKDELKLQGATQLFEG